MCHLIVKPLARIAFGLLALLASGSANAYWLVGNVTPTHQFMQECHRHLPQTRIVINVPKKAPSYRYDLGVKRLTEMEGTKVEGERVLGLTSSTHYVEASIRGDTLTDPRTGISCIRPTVYLTVSPGDQVVYVGREFPQGTCAHMMVLEHELRHVMANQAVAEQAARVAQKGLGEYFGQLIFYGPSARIGAQIVEVLEQEWFPWINGQMMQRRTSLHEQIDTPQERDRVSRACDGEVELRLRYTRF